MLLMANGGTIKTEKLSMKSAKKVKIDREVLFELLSIYRGHEGDKMVVKTIDPWGHTIEEDISQKLIKKANNIINNS